MSAIFFSIGNGQALMVIPDTQAHLDGHAIITYTYSIFKDEGQDTPQQEQSKESKLHLGKRGDPAYLGFITFEDPGRMFTYTPEGNERLSSEEVEEVIEQISHYRDNPEKWNHLNN
jgi:hypothetical protein